MRTIQVPGYGPVKFPESMSDEEIALAIEEDILPNIKPPKEGIGAAIAGGFKGLASRLQTAGEAIFSPEEAAQRGVARSEELGRQYAPGASLEAVKQAYAERGLLGGAGEVISQVPTALAEQLPNIAATLGGAKAGAMAGARFGPRGALIGGIGGAVAPSFAQLFGSNIERQAAEGAEEISRGRAAAAAAPGAALEVAATFIPLGRSIVGKLLGPQAREVLERGSVEAREALAQESLGRVLGRGAAIGVAAEVPTEVIQQMLERAQAGLPLTTDDALAEYGEAAYGAGLVGAPFGAAGRAGQRAVARGEVAAEEETVRAEARAREVQERRAEEEAEVQRKLTPEYRQALNAQMVEKKDRLRELENILKDKTLDAEVRDEAKEEAKTLRKELDTLTKEMKTSMKEAGVAPTLEGALARRRVAEAEETVTDEFGNVVKVKGKPLTPEEEAEGYERQSAKVLEQFREREAALERLREKEQQEQVRKDEELQTGIRTFLQQTEEMAELEPGAAAATREMAAEKRTKEAQAAAQEMTFDRINLVLEKFGLRAAGIEQEKRLDIESKVNEGRIDRTVTSALGIKGLGGRTVNAADALPNIQNRIQELEDRRQKALVSKDPLMLDNGQLTAKGYDLVATEAKLNELRKLQSVAQSQAPAETATEAGIVGQLQAASAAQAEELAVPEAQGLPKSAYPGRIETANKEASGAFDDLVSFVDDLQKKQYIGGVVSQLAIQDLNVSLRKLRTLPPDSPERQRLENRIAQQKAVLPTSTREKLEADVEASKERVINNLVNEVAFTRAQRNMQPLRVDEVQVFKEDIASLLDMLVERSLAPAPGMLAETTYKGGRETRRGLVEGATEVTEDPRSNIRQLPFGASEKKPRLLNPEEQKKVKTSLSQLKSAAIRANSVMQNLDAQIRELPPNTPQSEVQALLEERRALFDEAEKAQRDYVNYRTAIGLNLASTGVTQQQAVKNIKGVIRSLKESLIEEGKRPVRAERPVLRQQFQGYGPDESYLERGNRIVRDVQDLLNRPDIDPTVARTLEQAADLIATQDVNPTFLETVDEQIGRIKRGTDKPDASAALIDDIQQDMNQQRALRAYAEGEQFTMVPRGQGFAEVEVQPDLFPETRATMRATPATFQRLQKSREVRKAKEKIEKEKAETEQTRKAMIEAKRELEKELSEKLDVKKFRTKELNLMEKIQLLEKDIRTRAGYDEVVVSGLRYKWENSKNPQDIKQYEKEMAVYNARPPEERVKVRKPIHAGEWVIVGESTSKVNVFKMSEETARKQAILDKDIQNELAELRKLEKLIKNYEGTPFEQEAKKRLSIQRGIAIKAERALQDAKDKANKFKEALQARLARGLDLPETKVERTPVGKVKYVKPKAVYDLEMQRYREAIKGLTPQQIKDVPKPTKSTTGNIYKRRIVQVFSPSELDAALDVEYQQRANSLRRMQAVSPQEMAAKWREKEKEAKKAKESAKKALDSFVASVRSGAKAKNFPQYKKLADVFDRANAELRSIRENIKLLKAAEYNPDQIQRNAPVRTTTGPTKPARLGVTTDQMYDLLGERGRMVGSRTYSVDDIPDLRVGDTAPTGEIDVAAAKKYLAEVKKKAVERGLKFNYYPLTEVLPPKIRQAIDALGSYAKNVKGGVMPDGEVFVIIDGHSTLKELEGTVAHELIGHVGFEGFVGEQGMKNLLKKVEDTFGNVFKMADELGVGRQAEDAAVALWKLGADNERAKLQALREAIAYTMEKRVDQSFMEKAKRWMQELVGAFRAALKRLGLADTAKMTTSDLFYLMKQANANFEANKPIAKMTSDDYASFSVKSVDDTGIGAMIAQRGTAFDKAKSFGMGMTGLAGRVRFLDRFAALDKLVKRGVSQGTISSLKAMDVMYFNRMADQRNNFVAQFATSGVGKISKNAAGEISYEGGEGPSLQAVSAALNKSGVPSANVEAEFTKFLVALRADRVGVDKLDFTGKRVTKEEIKDTIAKYSGNDAFQEARKLYQQYNDNLIDFVVASGAMSKEKGAELKSYKDYVPFYRQRGNEVEMMIFGEKPIRIGDLKNQPYLQELVGGKEVILPVFTSALNNTSTLVDMALKNMATRNTAYVMQDLGVAKVYDKAGPASPNVIRFKRDGKEYHATINTEAMETLFGDIPAELVVQGLEGIKAVIPAGVRLLGMPANWLRKFVTRDPRYAIRQIFRDSMAAAMTTGANFVPVVQTFKDMATMKKAGTLEKLRERGVVGGQVIVGATDDMSKILQQISSGKPGWDMAMAKLDEFAMMGDAATRVSMYNSFLKQGLSEREATFATLEAMNFSRRGTSPTVLYANTLIPFFNAGLQGIDVLYRAFKGDMPASERLKVKQKLLARGAMMAMITMAYAAMMQDDETYENANPEERYGNWFVPTPFGTLRVPIPFELGLIFKAAPEGVYRAMFSDDKAGDVLSAMKTMATRSVPIDLPTAIKPGVELMLNKSFFMDREIVDPSMEGIDAQYQYRPKTPEVVKLFGQIGLSPVQVEYALRGYTGSLLVSTLRLLDPVLGGELMKPGQKLPDFPVLGGLFQPKDATGIINAAFTTAEQMQNAQRTHARLKVSDPDEAKEFYKESKTDIEGARAAGRFRQRMGEYTKDERLIRARKDLTNDEKSARLEKIRQEKIKYAKDFRRRADERRERQASAL